MTALNKLFKQYPDFKKLRALKNPKKIQDYLNDLPINWGADWNTCRSVLATLRAGKAHCMEGALVGAAALYFNGHKPLLLDLKTTRDDFDHVVALFQHNGCWGALSKTSHAVLRYREPIYKNLRELALSYFHEYFLDNGKKTLRGFSAPFDLRQYGKDWLVADYDLWQIPEELDDSPHEKILTRKMIATLRQADAIEIQAGKIKERF